MRTKWIVTETGDLEKVLIEEKKKSTPNMENIIHGTIGGYKYYKCRCQECTAAMRTYQKKFAETPEARERRNAKKREQRAKTRELLEK